MNDNTNVDGKKCRICGEFKVFSEFYRNKRTKDGHRTECKSCKSNLEKKNRAEGRYKEYDRLYREKNSDKIKKFQSQYRKENKEKHFSYFRERYENKREEILEKNKVYYQLNKTKIQERNKRYLIKNYDKIQNYKKEWFKGYFNTPKGREYYYNLLVKRRSYKHKVDFTPFQRKKLLERDNWTCQSCGCKVHDRHKGSWNTPDKAHIDHIIPISKGGNSEPSNLQVLCRTCNLSKNDKVEKQMELDFNTI